MDLGLVMLQEERPVRRRRLLSKRSFKICPHETDDRGWTLLHVGSRRGDLKEVKRLLDEGVEVNVAVWGPKSQGVTPLHLAAQGGHIKVMDELLIVVQILMPGQRVFVAGLLCMLLQRNATGRLLNF